MTIVCLRQMEYEGTRIYVMQFDMTFQYLYVWKGQIYMDRIELIPPLLKRALWRLGVIKNLYSKEQMEEGEKVVLNGAMRSIDTIKQQSMEPKQK